MMTFDDRLTFVNKLDQQVFDPTGEKAKKVKEKQEQKSTTAPTTTPEGQQPVVEDNAEQKLPIVLHEREIMENIENFLVTIVCGETGSGKSTQIPKFIYQASQECPWKFKNNQSDAEDA